MLSIKTDAEKIDVTYREKSERLIGEFLKTVLKETKQFRSAKNVRRDALAVIDEMDGSGDLRFIRSEDVERARKMLDEKRNEHGLRSWLNYHNRGHVQDYIHDVADMMRDRTIPFEEKLKTSVKMFVGMGAVSVATGAMAQTVLGASNYDKYMGASQEQLISDFLIGNDHYQSLMPVVAGAAAVAMTAKIGVSLATKPKSAAEAKKFDEYVDIRHAQVALKQLKKFVKDQGGCDKTKTADKPHLSQILLRERVAMR